MDSRLGILLGLTLLFGCDAQSPLDVDRPVTPPATEPPPPPQQSTGRYLLELEDTVRFTRRLQSYSPAIRLVDAAGNPLDPSQIRWTIGDVLIVSLNSETKLVSNREGVTRVIGEVGSGATLVADTIVAIVSLVPGALSMHEAWPGAGLVPGDTLTPLVEVRDSLGHSAMSMFASSLALFTQIDWSSSDPAVAIVGTSGLVRGIAPGQATITATWRGLRASFDITVSAPLSFPVREINVANGINAGLSELAVGPDGTIYNLERHYRTGQITAATPDGTVLWRRALSLDARQLKIAEDGTIHFLDAGIHAMSPGGELLWRSSTCSASNSVALGPGSMVYCLERSRLVAVDGQGRVKWTFARGDLISPNDLGAVVTLPDGTIYIVAGQTVRLSPAGEESWRLALQAEVNHVAADAGGTIYVSTRSKETLAIAPEGRIRWRVQGISGALAIGPDRTLLIAEDQRRMVSALRQEDGSGKWRTANPAIRENSAALHVGADGRLYVASNCHLHVFAMETGSIVGRSREYACSHVGSTFVQNRLYIFNFTQVFQYSVPTEPGSEWSQAGGSARKAQTPVDNGRAN